MSLPEQLLTLCPPPKGFKPAEKVTWARMHPVQPWFIKRKKVRGRRRQGVLYEQRALKSLDATSPLPLIPSPWIEFGAYDLKPRWCQPDGLLVDVRQGTIIILECKYQHTSDAWWQLRHLYSPVVRALLPGWEVALVEVVKWFDPATSFPERVAMLPDPAQPEEGCVGVHILNP